MKNIGLFNKPQELNLRRALKSIQFVGAEGFDHAVVMPDDVVDILLRCDAVDVRRLVLLLVAVPLENYVWCLVLKI